MAKTRKRIHARSLLLGSLAVLVVINVWLIHRAPEPSSSVGLASNQAQMIKQGHVKEGDQVVQAAVSEHKKRHHGMRGFEGVNNQLTGQAQTHDDHLNPSIPAAEHHHPNHHRMLDRDGLNRRLPPRGHPPGRPRGEGEGEWGEEGARPPPPPPRPPGQEGGREEQEEGAGPAAAAAAPRREGRPEIHLAARGGRGGGRGGGGGARAGARAGAPRAGGGDRPADPPARGLSGAERAALGALGGGAKERVDIQEWKAQHCEIKPGVVAGFVQECCKSRERADRQEWRPQLDPLLAAPGPGPEGASGGGGDGGGGEGAGTVAVYKCLPGLVVAGTQKSGSTALTGYLLQHPNVQMAKMKELHFFDDKRNMDKGLAHYLEMFQESVEGGENRTLNGEATPYYLHSKEACKNIAMNAPHAKLIVLLRNPIDRAYSEWQMKKRRVDDQSAFFDQMNEDAGRLYRCLVESLGDFPGVSACAGPRLTGSFGWPRFAGFLRRKRRKAPKERPQIQGEFYDFEDRRAAAAIASAAQPITYETEDISTLDLYKRFHMCFLFDGVEISEHEELKTRLQAALADEDALGRFAQTGGLLAGGSRNVSFPDQPRCYTGYETIKPFEEAIERDIDDLTNCFVGLKVGATIEHYHEYWDRCIRLTHGISKQYIHRSLYALQVYHCLQYVPRENLLVVESSELHNNHQKALAAIHSHVGLPDYNYEKSSPKDLDEVIDHFYPLFEDITGWHLDSSYEPMHSNTRARLKQFFYHQNEMLFEFLGRRYSWT